MKDKKGNREGPDDERHICLDPALFPWNPPVLFPPHVWKVSLQRSGEQRQQLSRQGPISWASQTLSLWVMFMALYPPSPSAIVPALHRPLQSPCQQRGLTGGSFYISKIILWNSRILWLEGTIQTISSNPLILKMLQLGPERRNLLSSICGLVWTCK